MKRFDVIQGRNGAKYIVNRANWLFVYQSLTFYQVYTFKQLILKLYYISIQLIRRSARYSDLELVELLGLDEDSLYLFRDNTAGYVSPRANKIVVLDLKTREFSKMIFGSEKVKLDQEYAAYLKLECSRYFAVPTILSYDRNKDFSALVFKNIILPDKFKGQKIRDILVDLFLTDSFNNSVSYSDALISELESVNLSRKIDEKGIIKISQRGKQIMIPLGFVHNDFKPRNTIVRKGVFLLYDFEEAEIKGLPGIDLLNYYLDQDMKQRRFDSTVKKMSSKSLKSCVQEYFRKLKVKIDHDMVLLLFVVQRIRVWQSHGDTQLAQNYIDLLGILMKNNFDWNE